MNIVENKNALLSLNEQQLKAASHYTGPMLVLAGAGTGKTRVIISRIYNLIANYNINPGNILAVTFTNKAANEMLLRLNNICDAKGIYLGTFHAIATKILRIHSHLINIDNNFTIIDMDDQIRLVKAVMKDLNIDSQNIKPKTILDIIQKWKDLALLPNQVPSSELDNINKQLAIRVYHEYQDRLFFMNGLDFGDLLMYNLQLFNNNPDILNLYQHKFQFIMVDEYQDTNLIQYLWLKLLSKKHQNILCVGDDDQSIYGWRGAEIGNILRFDQDFKGAETVKLEQNYRSTTAILTIASELINNNQMRLGKSLWTTKEEYHKVEIASLVNDIQEANFVSRRISRLRQEKPDVNYRDTAILVRAGFQTRLFEEALMNLHIPYQVVGGLKFYDRAEIKDAIAYVRATIQISDNLAFIRIINTPRRAIGTKTILMLTDYANQNKISMQEASKILVEQKQIKGKGASNLMELIDNFENWRTKFADEKPAIAVERILQESGYIEMWKIDNSLDAQMRIENLKEFIRALNEFDNLNDFLEHVSLVSDLEQQNNGDKVNIMTLHSAKGLEFDYVFLPGWEEGLFPHQKSLMENSHKAIEEERRLAYVGITRAKKHLIISWAKSRYFFGNWQICSPSRFLSELPEKYCQYYESAAF